MRGFYKLEASGHEGRALECSNLRALGQASGGGACLFCSGGDVTFVPGVTRQRSRSSLEIVDTTAVVVPNAKKEREHPLDVYNDGSRNYCRKQRRFGYWNYTDVRSMLES